MVFKNLRKFCLENDIDYEWARYETRHKYVESFDELKVKWAANTAGKVSIVNTTTTENKAIETAPRAVPDDFTEEELSTFDLQSLKLIKLQKDIKHKELESEKVRVAIQKTKSELVPFSMLVDLIGTVATLTRVQVSSLISSLPAQLEGLPADKLTIIIRQEIERVLQELSTNVGTKLEELKESNID